MLDVCCKVTSHDECVVMVKTKKRMSVLPTCCCTATFGYTESVTRKCCSSQVSTLNEYTLPAEREAPNALVVVWYGTQHDKDHGR